MRPILVFLAALLLVSAGILAAGCVSPDGNATQPTPPETIPTETGTPVETETIPTGTMTPVETGTVTTAATVLPGY